MRDLLRTIIPLTLMLVVSQFAYGQEDSSPETMVERTELLIEYMEQANIRLRLTDDQDVQLRAILKENVEKTRAILQEHDIVPGAELSFSQKTSLARALRPIKKESEKKMKAILSSDQMKEFEKIRKEILDEIEARHKVE
jgi:hypothetical protein